VIYRKDFCLEFDKLEDTLGYEFKDKRLLERALTHASYSYDSQNPVNYERLEFLGDAVLQVLASEYLYRLSPEWDEGAMTKKRIAMVCEDTLIECSYRLKLTDYLLSGKGDDETDMSTRASITADLVESILGAVFIDGGYKSAKRVFTQVILKHLKDADPMSDHKSELQRLTQSLYKNTPVYECVRETGQLDDKTFLCRVLVNGKPYGQGEGRTKKKAEQNAAGVALRGLTRDLNERQATANTRHGIACAATRDKSENSDR